MPLGKEIGGQNDRMKKTPYGVFLLLFEAAVMFYVPFLEHKTDEAGSRVLSRI